VKLKRVHNTDIDDLKPTEVSFESLCNQKMWRRLFIINELACHKEKGDQFEQSLSKHNVIMNGDQWYVFSNVPACRI